MHIVSPAPAAASVGVPLRSQPPHPQPNILDSDDTTPASAVSSPSSSAVPAAAPGPPRPPNPELVQLRSLVSERLTSSLTSLQDSLSEDFAQLGLLHTDLAKGEPALQDEIARLEAVKEVCTSVRDRLADVVRRAEENVSVVSERRDVEVDEIVCSTTVVYNQLLDLVAEDNALDDTIYQLGRGLNSDTAKIDLDRFLKVRTLAPLTQFLQLADISYLFFQRVRSLAREQFYKRALINKILLEMALGQIPRDRLPVST
jgi:ESCRT-I complex subunit TSG101